MLEHNSGTIKMSRSLRKHAEKAKEKVDFRLQFHATRLPQTGWDRLVVSLIPADTGRMTSKTQKAYVRNGNCQWPDAVIESALLSFDVKSKEYEEKSYRIVVSMALSRTGVLGEVAINLADFVAVVSPTTVALPLKNCSYGTVLHIKIQCLTCSANSREADPQREEGVEYADDSSEVDGDLDILGNQPHNSSYGDPKGIDGSESTTRKSYDVSESSSLSRGRWSNGNSWVSVSGDSSSPTSSVSSLSDRQDHGGKTRSGNQDLSSSYSSPQKNARSLAANSYQSQNSYKRSDPVNASPVVDGMVKEDFPFTGSQSSFQNVTRHLKMKVSAPADQHYFQSDMDLHSEVKKLETHESKCKAENESLKLQLSAQIKQVADCTAEISALMAERDSVNAELQRLKNEKQSSVDDENCDDRQEAEDSKRIIRELNEEITFQKETNLNLNLQLRKIQESNMELVSAIQELEESLEEQRRDMEKLSLKNDQLDSSLQAARAQRQDAQTTEERAFIIRTQNLEEQIKVLEEKLSAQEPDHSVKRHINLSSEPLPSCRSDVDRLTKEIEDLERDIKELTDENMELIFNLNTAKQQLASKDAEIGQLEAKLKTRSSAGCNGTTPNADLCLAAANYDILTDLPTQDVHLNSLREDYPEAEQENTNAQMVAQLKVDFGNVEKENASLVQEVEKLKQAENDKDALIIKVQRLEEEIEALLQRETSHLLQAKELDLKVTQAEKTNASLEGELQHSQERERVNLSRVEKLALRLSKVLEGTESATMFGEDLEAILTLIEQGISALQQALETSQEEHSLEKTHAESLAQDLAAVNDQIHSHAEVRADLEKRVSQMDVLENDLRDQIASLVNKNLQLSETNKRLEEYTRHVNGDIETSRSEKDAMENVILELRKENKELEIKLQVLIEEQQMRLLELERKKTDLQECEMHKKASNDLEIQTGNLQNDAAYQAEVIRSLEERVIVLQGLNIEAEKSAISLKNDHATAIREKLSLHSEMDSLMRSFAEKEKKYAEELEILKSSKVFAGGSSGDSGSQVNLELADLWENVKLLEDKVRQKVVDLETLKQEFAEKETVLCEKIDFLEIANERLAEGQEDSGLEQLQHELTRLQNHNALLLRREQELVSKLGTQELLQSEMQRLQEENEQLDCKLSKMLETLSSGNPLERIMQLETELADALEANNMYKAQLQSAFAQQNNVHAAALQNLGDVDKVISDLTAYKKQSLALEEDLKEMRDRYFSMSLKYAEVEAEKEELILTIRSFRNGQRR